MVHVAANPSVPGNVASLEARYVFPEHPVAEPWQDYTVTACDCPNEASQSLDRFVADLMKAARAAREQYAARYYGKGGESRDFSSEELAEGSSSRWVLLGDRGIGKTIFLNYLFAVCTPRMHDARVIWYRVDYTKPVAAGVTLQSWLRYQFCQVLWNYYDKAAMEADLDKREAGNALNRHWETKLSQGMVFDLSSANDKLFDRALRGGAGLSRGDFDRVLMSTRDAVRNSEMPIDVPPWLFRAIWDHLAVDEGVAIISVIDGLDKLSLSSDEEAAFLIKLNEVRALTSVESAEQCVYLVTMRYESFRHHFVNGQFLRAYTPVVLQEVPGNDIWKKKLAHLGTLRTVSAARYPHVAAAEADRRLSMVAALLEAYGQFLSYSVTTAFSDGEPSPNIERGFAILEQIFGTNRRQLFEALTAVIRFFIYYLPARFDTLLDALVAQSGTGPAAVEDVQFNPAEDALGMVRRAHYLFIEALMLQTPANRFYAGRYAYRTIVGARGQVEFRRETTGPEKYLYNAFSPPFSRSRVRVACTLVPLRTIQYLMYCQPVAPRWQIREFLESHFRYPGFVIDAVLDELLDGGVVRPYARGEVSEPDDLEVTERGRFIVDHLSFALEYLALSLQAAPIPAALVDEGLFPVRAYGSPEFVIDNKIVATINFVRYISDIEKREEVRFNDRQRKERSSSTRDVLSFRDYNGHDFRLGPRMRQRVTQALDRTIDRAVMVNNERLVAQLRDRLETNQARYFGAGQQRNTEATIRR